MCIALHSLPRSLLHLPRIWLSMFQLKVKQIKLPKGNHLPQNSKPKRKPNLVHPFNGKELNTFLLTLAIRSPLLPTLVNYHSEFLNQDHTLTGSLHTIHPHLPDNMMLVLNKFLAHGTNPHVNFENPFLSLQARSEITMSNTKLSKAGAVPPTLEAITSLIPCKGIG